MRAIITILTTAILALSTIACGAHSTAADTVRFVDAGAICQPALERKEFQSTRCAMSNGVKVYCTESAQGFACSSLTGQPAAAHPSAPTTPPAAPASSTPAPPAK
jgi:hypothetical protein